MRWGCRTGAGAIMAADRAEEEKKTIGISKQTDEKERGPKVFSGKFFIMT